MRLDDQRESSNIENRRNEGGGLGFGRGGQQAGGMGGGGLGSLLGLLMPLIGSKFGLIGIVIAFGALWLLGGLGGGGPSMAPSSQVTAPASAPAAAPGSELTNSTDRFVSKVLASTEDTWGCLLYTSPSPRDH
jgi:predicted metalloprotease